MRHSNYTLFAGLFACVLIFSPSVSEAGINKCTDSAGIVTYSDQPCSIKDGQKPAEVKNTAEFAAFATQENEKAIAKTCMALAERRSNCGIYVESNLSAAFNNNCDAPVKRSRLQKQREQNRSYSHRDDTDSYQEQQAEEKMQCGEVQAAMWKFIKENFRPRLSENDIKVIEYHLTAVPSDGSEPGFAKRARKR